MHKARTHIHVKDAVEACERHYIKGLFYGMVLGATVAFTIFILFLHWH